MIRDRQGSGDHRRPVEDSLGQSPDAQPQDENAGGAAEGVEEGLPYFAAETPELWERLGEAYLKSGDCERAIDALERVVAAGRATGATFASLGRAASRLSRREEAARYFEAALDESPDDPGLWRELGVARRRSGTAGDAVPCFREALRLEGGEKSESWRELGRALRDLGERSEAIHAYREALRLEPDRSDLWNDLATLYTETEQFAESDQALREAIRLRPNNASAWRAIAQNALKRGESQAARQAYLRMKELSPDFAEEILTWVSSTAGLPADSLRPSLPPPPSPTSLPSPIPTPPGRLLRFRSGPRD